MLKYLLAVGVGAALVYFLDPDRGPQRREAAAKQLSNVAQLNAEQLEDIAQYTANTAQELFEITASLEIDGIPPAAPVEQSYLNAAYIYNPHTHLS